MAEMKRPEQELQIQVVRHLRAVLLPPAMFFHVPNGGKRTVVEAAKFKQMGVVSGVPDLIITWIGPNGPIMLAIELKAGKGKLTDNQADVCDKLRGCGWFVVEARSVDDVCEALNRYHAPIRGRI